MNRPLVEGLSRESDRWDEIRTPAELLGLWERKNAEAVAANFLPGGMLHFNLLFKVRCPLAMPGADNAAKP